MRMRSETDIALTYPYPRASAAPSSVRCTLPQYSQGLTGESARTRWKNDFPGSSRTSLYKRSRPAGLYASPHVPPHLRHAHETPRRHARTLTSAVEKLMCLLVPFSPHKMHSQRSYRNQTPLHLPRATPQTPAVRVRPV